MIQNVLNPPSSRLSRRALLARSVVLTVLLAGGCRSQPPSPAGPPPGITFLSPLLSVGAAQTLFASQVNAAAAEVGVTANYQSGSGASIRRMLRAADAAGQFPDVVEIASVDVPRLVSAGLVREVRALFEAVSGVNGDLFPPLFGLATAGPWVNLPSYQKPSIWAIPHLSLGTAWLVRHDVLGKKAIPPPTTFSDFRAAAEQLTDSATGRFGWGAPLPDQDSVDDLAQLILLDHGAGLFEINGLRVAFSSSDVAAGLSAFAGLYRSDSGKNLAPAGAMEWSVDDAATAFASGQVAQTIDPGGMYARIVTAVPQLRDQIQALPPPVGPKGHYTAAPTTVFVVSARSTVSDGAMGFLERLMSPGRYEDLTRAGAGSIVPPYTYLTRSPFWDDDPNFPAFAANARGDPARNFQFATPGSPAPLTLPVAEVRSRQILTALLRSVVSGNESAADASLALGERCRAVAREGYALQPPPPPQATPEWLRILQSIQRLARGAPGPANGR